MFMPRFPLMGFNPFDAASLFLSLSNQRYIDNTSFKINTAPRGHRAGKGSVTKDDVRSLLSIRTGRLQMPEISNRPGHLAKLSPRVRSSYSSQGEYQ
tara:strand:- start:1371 stop:1661 length:291 start_codon:yes stop_codon:yes gene_type:complete